MGLRHPHAAAESEYPAQATARAAAPATAASAAAREAWILGIPMSVQDTRTGAYEGAGLSDASFHPPTREASAGRLPTGHEWFVFDIPKPPSVNRLQGHFGNRSNVVVKWAVQADRWLMAMGRYPHIKGPYELIVALPEREFGKYDCDNRIKILSDWLQRVQMIENDKFCRELWIRWTTEISAGCRVSVRAWREA